MLPLNRQEEQSAFDLSHGCQLTSPGAWCAVCAGVAASTGCHTVAAGIAVARPHRRNRPADRGVLLRRLRLTQPAPRRAVQHLRELRRRMVAAEFLVTAWPADVVASGQNGGDQSDRANAGDLFIIAQESAADRGRFTP